MNPESISRANALVLEIAALPEPRQTELINMFRYVLTGIRLADNAKEAKA